MRYYIIAGEASGDMHAANLMREIALEDRYAVFRCHGGDKMRDAGGEIVRHYKDTAVMGFLTVLKNLGKIKRNLDFIKKDIKEWQPDVVIFVDFPGFNLKIAKYVKSIGIKTYYYISPKIWAWKKWRIKSIKKYIDKMLCIFPFEVDFYNQYDYPVFYGGNPLVDAIENNLDRAETKDEFISKNKLEQKPIIALLAGSRSQELKNILPEMLNVMSEYSDYQFVIAGAPSMTNDDYREYIGDYKVEVVYDQTYQLVRHADAALVASGTATLETAIINTPEVVCYNAAGGKLLYNVLSSILKIKYVSLVNIIMGKETVKELLQHNLNKELITKELNAILYDDTYRNKMLSEFDELREKLGSKGASNRFAKEIVRSLS